MSHIPGHDPTPTPTSKPDDSELDAKGMEYSGSFDQGHADGYNFGKKLGGVRIDNAANAPVAGEPVFALPPADGSASRSGYRDGFSWGFRRSILALRLEDPNNIPFLAAMEGWAEGRYWW